MISCQLGRLSHWGHQWHNVRPPGEVQQNPCREPAHGQCSRHMSILSESAQFGIWRSQEVFSYHKLYMHVAKESPQARGNHELTSDQIWCGEGCPILIFIGFDSLSQSKAEHSPSLDLRKEWSVQNMWCFFFVTVGLTFPPLF